VYLDNVDVTTTLRADSVVDWPGATLHLYGLGNQGGNPSERVGDAQVTSSIEAPLSWRLYEAWLQQTLGTRASVLVGLYDLNAEFDANRTGGLFLNSSHGIGAAFGLSGRNGPSIFPVTSMAVRGRLRVARRGYVQAAVLDGVPGDPADPGGTVVRFGDDDGVLAASEAGVYLGGEVPLRMAMVDRTLAVDAPLELAVGGWTYTTPLRPWPQVNRPNVVPVATRGSAGAYLLAEGRVLREPGTSNQGLSGFVRLGWANDQYNRFSRHVGAGVVYTGPFAGRDVDRVGLAVATALNSDAYEAAQRRAGRPVTDVEVNVEATYAAPLTNWLTLVGDLQYVANPNTDPSIPNAFVPGVRVVVTLP
jgi:porin